MSNALLNYEDFKECGECISNKSICTLHLKYLIHDAIINYCSIRQPSLKHAYDYQHAKESMEREGKIVPQPRGPYPDIKISIGKSTLGFSTFFEDIMKSRVTVNCACGAADLGMNFDHFLYNLTPHCPDDIPRIPLPLFLKGSCKCKKIGDTCYAHREWL